MLYGVREIAVRTLHEAPTDDAQGHAATEEPMEEGCGVVV
jgi:hypothetical protein